MDGKIVNPEGVHMEAIAFGDADGDLHACTNWAIYTTGAAPELAWETPCIGGVERLHTLQGDGTFVNSLAGRTSFLPNTDYELRVRFRDNRGAFSAPASRLFTTGGASAVFSLQLEDVLASPAPAWTLAGSGAAIDLPAGVEPAQPQVAGAASGPDGLYFTEMYKGQDFATPIDRGARIFRVRFVGGADFITDVTAGTPNLAVRFSDTSNMLDIAGWLWDFGDVTTSTEQNPVHVYREQGDFDVSLRVTGAGGANKVTEKHELIRVRTGSAPGLQGVYYDNVNFTNLAAAAHAQNGPVDLANASLQYDASTDTMHLTVPRSTSGNYTLKLLANGAAGARLDGNSDNVGGDNFNLTFTVDARQLGDADGDGDVDLDDLNHVRNNFGGQGLGDADGDSDVDLDDLNAVRNNFGLSLLRRIPDVREAVFARFAREEVSLGAAKWRRRT